MKNTEAFKKGIAVLLVAGSIATVLSACAPLTVAQYADGEYRYADSVIKDSTCYGQKHKGSVLVKYNPLLIADYYKIDIDRDTLKYASVVHALLQINNILDNIRDRKNIVDYGSAEEADAIDAYEIEQWIRFLQNVCGGDYRMGNCSYFDDSLKTSTEQKVENLINLLKNIKVKRDGKTIKMTISSESIQQLADMAHYPISINEKGEIENPLDILRQLICRVGEDMMSAPTIAYLIELRYWINCNRKGEENDKTALLDGYINKLSTNMWPDGWDNSTSFDELSNMYNYSIIFQSNKDPEDTYSDVIKCNQFATGETFSKPLNEIESGLTFMEVAKDASQYNGTYEPVLNTNTK